MIRAWLRRHRPTPVTVVLEDIESQCWLARIRNSA